MYLAQYLRRDTITRVPGLGPTTRICRRHCPRLSLKRKKKEIEGKDEKKKYIKYRSMYHTKVVRNSSKKER